MRRHPWLWTATVGGGSVPVVSAVSYGVVDTAGGGQREVVTVDSSTGCTAIAAGGVSFASFAIDDATHVSGIPGAHAAGVVDVVVTNATGDSTTGTGLIEYWTPAQVTGISAYLDANKGVTLGTGTNVTAWLDQSSNARNFVNAADDATCPDQTASVFGSLPSIRYAKENLLALASEVVTASGASKFAVAKWTDSDATAAGFDAVPLCIVGSMLGGWGGFGASADALQAATYTGVQEVTTRGSGLNDGTARLVGCTYDGVTNMKLYVGTSQQGATSTYAAIDNRNAYDTIGNGTGAADGFAGDLGAVVIVDGVISGGDLTKLDNWSKQRFDTP